ncbi:unnamed protein product [Cuscuta campestris]|uniref:3-oxoacyl-[acyl-carrier-protein] reductase n=1 Tax=Cuscuta campestris TaxID=132261 RepID=A0A484L655_9ASTE|nr:unnamed protein product [Cuscuta campestris]
MESRVRVTRHLEPWQSLAGKVVLVTGASSGIGRDISLDLAKSGCRVIAAARRVERLKSLCDEINGMESMRSGEQPGSVAIGLDVSADGAAIEAAVRKAWDSFGRIDALVNNAGVRGKVHTPLELTEEEWDENMKTNLRGTWLVSKYVCLLMRNANVGGSVINVSSISGLNRVQLPGALAYVCSKTAVNALTRVMALELGKHKIRVNSISPGLFKSEITEGLIQKEWLNNVAQRTVPLRTYGTIDPAITSLVRYLIHDSSQYVSGNVYIVDAGDTLPALPIFSTL